MLAEDDFKNVAVPFGLFPSKDEPLDDVRLNFYILANLADVRHPTRIACQVLCNPRKDPFRKQERLQGLSHHVSPSVYLSTRFLKTFMF